MVNAFAIPGGYVYVTRGLMALANSEAEFAGVVGHEIGHVTARHSAQQSTQSTFAALAAAAVGIALQDQQAADLANMGAMAWVTSYSRSQELEADQVGLLYMARAGYDPAAAVDFWRRFAEYNRQAGGSETPWFLRTHPLDETRIRDLQEALPKAKAEYRAQ